MNHLASARFWEQYHKLPENVKSLADRSFALLRTNPSHPSLQFKKVGRFWSARVGLRHRALAVEIPDGLLWVWIGDHEDYERMLNQ